jgi:dihydrodipicolinate synthase/N-acetylneuraminate lyase
MSHLAQRFAQGVAIPATPLALNAHRKFDESAQRAIIRYHSASGADGLAVGVHTTQFDLHADPQLLDAVWSLAAEEAAEGSLLVAGVVGDTEQAVREAETAAARGYSAALLCPYGMSDSSDDALVERARAVGEVLPTIGFYLQDAVGGGLRGRPFWRRLFDLPSTVAVKAAPFDRYRTNDVARALVEHDRWRDITLLTGNDDAIVHDLITPYVANVAGEKRTVRASGGLLGQWAVGTRAAVEIHRRSRAAVTDGMIDESLLSTASDLVEVNSAVFDVAHAFAGCVAGVNEVLLQQGLLSSSLCLGNERLSDGQSELITQVRTHFPYLLDEAFIDEHRDDWLR